MFNLLFQSLSKFKFQIGFGLNLCFSVFEIIVGLLTGSTALVSDAVHNLSDAFGIMIAWIANTVSTQKPTQNQTYGLRRAKIIGALINAILLIVVGFWILWEAYLKVLNPQAISGQIISIVALIGIVINIVAAFLFASKNDKDINNRATFVNMTLDAVASFLVMIGGIVIQLTGNKFVDPTIGVIIAGLLLYNGWLIIRQVSEVLLEMTPLSIDSNKVRELMLSHSCVRQVVDLHIWSISTDYTVLTAVVNIEVGCVEHLDRLIIAVKKDISDNFAIHHQTIETRLQADSHID